MAKKVEQKVADALLERTIQVKVGAKVYEAPAPTLGTLVMVSELIADLPELDTKEDVAAIFRNARHGREIARICAIFILGAKAVRGEQISSENRLRNLLKLRGPFTKADALTDEILLNCTSADISRIVANLVDASNLDDFFELSTFLKEVNLTKPTKVEKETTATKVEKETTASGQS